MNLTYKKIEEKDKEQLFKLIQIVLGGLENKEYFIPYEQWELDNIFDEKTMHLYWGLTMEINLLEWHNCMFHKICLQISKENLN